MFLLVEGVDSGGGMSGDKIVENYRSLMAPGSKAFPASSFILRGPAYSLHEHVSSAFKGCFFLDR